MRNPCQILRFITDEETASYWFITILSTILNNPCKTVHPVVEGTRHFIESELISDPRNRLFDSTASLILLLQLTPRSFKTRFSIRKDKSFRNSSGEQGAIIMKHDASRILIPLLIYCRTLICPYVPKKFPARFDDGKFRFSLSKSGKTQSTKRSWLKLLSYAQMSNTISLRPVEKIVWNIRTSTRHMLRFFKMDLFRVV
jgi:hypothetical protein